MKIDGFIKKEKAEQILKDEGIEKSEVKAVRQFKKDEVNISFRDHRPTKIIKL